MTDTDIKDLVNFIEANKDNPKIKAEFQTTPIYEGHKHYLAVTIPLSDAKYIQISKALNSSDSDKKDVKND